MKKENNFLKSQLETYVKSIKSINDDINKLKNENTDLKMKIRSFKSDQKEIERLKSENKGLKKYIGIQQLYLADYSKLTLIIPYRKTKDQDRELNVDIILKYLNNIGIQNIIISEHSDVSDKEFLMEEYSHLFNSFKVIYNNAHGKLFNIAKAVNRGVIESKTPYIAMYDFDCLTEKKNIDLALVFLEIGYDVVHPFNRNVSQIVNKEKFKEGYNFKLGTIPEERPTADGGIVFFNKRSFISIGMANEYYVGWGGEDNDIMMRAEVCNLKMHRIEDTLYHLDHYRPQQRIQNNWDQMEKTSQMKNRRECLAEINKWTWVIEAKKQFGYID